ncbi:sorting nexin-10A [Clarias gariepinus]
MEKSDISEMEDMRDMGSLIKKEFVNVWIRDPQLHREDYWHTHIDYEICLHTNSMCFQKKTSCVRRRYSEFVWLRQRLQNNALLVQLPKLPPANPFFSLSNTLQLNKRIEGLQKFLEAVMKMPLLLSDSHLHLFLQSQLSIAQMDACVHGLTRYTVAEAIQRYVYDTHIPLKDDTTHYCDSDCERCACLGICGGAAAPIEVSSQNGGSVRQFLVMGVDPEPFICISLSLKSQQDTHT